MSLLAWILIYLTGAFVTSWFLWFTDHWEDEWYRPFEVMLWPVSIIVATVRKYKEINEAKKS